MEYDGIVKNDIDREVCNKLEKFEVNDTHKKLGVKGFTRFYPWTIYYSDRELDYPTDGFGIWFVNGLIKYPSSIRLGLTQYMGSVEKARGYIHKQKENRLFSGKNQNDWAGSKTWLHIIFNKSLKSCLSLKNQIVFLLPLG